MSHHNEHELCIPTAWGQLAGTLCLPAGDGPRRLVLLIGGSGPTDRNGHNPLLPSPVRNLQLLAHALAARGLATFRYDKRGLGGSTCADFQESTLRFDQLVDDAVACCAHLGPHPELAPGGALLLGHSEGALVAALAAEAAGAAGAISLEGAGERASTLMRRQVLLALPPDLLEPALRAIDALESGQPAPDVPDDLMLLFRPSLQPYLISWFQHDPAAVLAGLRVPVLLLHGDADAQVDLSQARRLEAACRGTSLQVVRGMDHSLAIGGDTARGTGLVAGRVRDWWGGLGQDPWTPRATVCAGSRAKVSAEG